MNNKSAGKRPGLATGESAVVAQALPGQPPTPARRGSPRFFPHPTTHTTRESARPMVLPTRSSSAHGSDQYRGSCLPPPPSHASAFSSFLIALSLDTFLLSIRAERVGSAYRGPFLRYNFRSFSMRFLVFIFIMR